MPTNRNNDEVCKAFAIGAKIEYMNKLYEVVGYSIAYYKFVEKPHYSVCKLDTSVYTYYGSPVFKNEADAQYVINNPNFRSILDVILKS